MNTNNKYKRRKRKCNFLLTILILLTTFISSTTTTDLNSTVILDIEFTTDQYTGYISENVAAVKLYNENSRIINSRTNSRSILKTNKLSQVNPKTIQVIFSNNQNFEKNLLRRATYFLENIFQRKTGEKPQLK